MPSQIGHSETGQVQSAANITTHRKGFSMSAIFTGGNTRRFRGVTASVSRYLHKESRRYKAITKNATVFLVMVLIGCAKPNAPTQVHVDETPEPLQEAQPIPVPQDRFRLTLYLDEPMGFPDDVYSAIVRAANQWESVIVSGLPDVPASMYSHLSIIPQVGAIDDLLVKFVWKETSNPFSVATMHLTVARPATMGGLPFYAEVWMYDYLKSLPQESQKAAILHEIGHALGFSRAYIEKYLEVVSSVKYYNGAHGVKGYREVLYYLGEKLSFAIPDLRIPMEMESTHWKYPEMMWDIMQPHVAPQSVISKVTLGMLHDLGHVVDYTKSQMPHPTLTKPAIGRSIFNHEHDHTHIHVVLPEGRL